MSKVIRLKGSSELNVARIEREASEELAANVVLALRVYISEAKDASKVITQFFEPDTRSTIKAVMWRKDGGVRETGIGSIPVKGVYDGQAIVLSRGERSVMLEDASMKRIRLQPVAGGGLVVSFDTSAYCSATVWDWLRDAVAHGQVSVELTTPAQADLVDRVESAEKLESEEG